LPIPLQKQFTYEVSRAEADFLSPGMRVAVPFGKSKIFTALVYEKHNKPPTAYEAKEIHQILDESPLITEPQLKFWEWISAYYMCSLGEVMRASLPSFFLLESETVIRRNDQTFPNTELSEDERAIFSAVQHQNAIKIDDVVGILSRQNVLPVINNLLKKGLIYVQEEIFELYKPKLEKYIQLNDMYKNPEALQSLMEELKRAKRKSEAVLGYFSVKKHKDHLKLKEYKEATGISATIIKSLTDTGVFEIYTKAVDRNIYDKGELPLKELNGLQQEALVQVQEAFSKHEVTLLHGITSSGKTEIYSKLIAQTLSAGKQVLYLLPEIALTTQIIGRLQKHFGNQMAVYHSRFSVNERVEVWNNVLGNTEKAQLVLGARSAVLLPFSKLGLIIVDEEHETSYKQYDPAPRYHARDASIVLAKIHQAKNLLGSATPSIESYYNAKHNKYGLVELNKRFGDSQLPDIELTDIKDKHKRKQMQGHFSDSLMEQIQESLTLKEQVILFQNRRGYSPVVECRSCGNSPQCPHCDVSLTYHMYNTQLRCHYCGYHQPLPVTCPSCGNPGLETKGFGTEQIETEISELFPNSRVARLDLDTTRGKHGFYKIITAFEDREIDILVGTQMLSKGLDFDHVSLVGIMNADNMLNFPDFRAHERSFQLMTQVAGRAGRTNKRGKVIIQTFNPCHQILQQISVYDYLGMYRDQINERNQFQYPPFVRMIKISLKHKDQYLVNKASEWLALSLRNNFGTLVLGPANPMIARIRNLYIKNILIKLPKDAPLAGSKDLIQRIRNSFESIAEFRPVRFIIDVDPFN